jgi:hypothetical protein
LLRYSKEVGVGAGDVPFKEATAVDVPMDETIAAEARSTFERGTARII